jgi:hypothetical protein
MLILELPKARHSFQLQGLAALVANSGDLLGEPTVAEVRTVAVQIEQGTWHNFGTLLRVHAAEHISLQPQRADLDRVVLVAAAVEAKYLDDAEKLREFLTQWRREVGASSGYPFQEEVNFDHYPSRNNWMNDPGWVFSLYEKVDDQSNYGAPSGPFFSLKSNVFDESVGALAADWLNWPHSRNESVIQRRYYIVVPDRRGRIQGLHVEEEHLHVTVNSIPTVGTLHCASVRQGLHNDIHRYTVPIRDGRVALPFSKPFKDLQLWVFTEDGEWVDRYSENEYGSSWKRFSLLDESPIDSDPVFADLMQALGIGESNLIEFKSFLKPARGDDKTQELLESVIAFSNASGGSIYIGVNNNLEPIGVGRDLKKAYAGECRGDLQRMEDAYVRDIRKLIAEGVDPKPEFSMDWTMFAQHRILRIDVRRGKETPYTVAANGDIYIRTGANNRKLRQADIPRFFRQDGSIRKI